MTTNLTGCQVHDVEKISFHMRVGRWDARAFSSAGGSLVVGVDGALSALALAVLMAHFVIVMGLTALIALVWLVRIVGFPISDSADRRRTRTKNDAFVGQCDGSISVSRIGIGISGEDGRGSQVTVGTRSQFSKVCQVVLDGHLNKLRMTVRQHWWG